MRPMRPQYDPRDERDLEILDRAAAGETQGEIARMMNLTSGLVAGVIKRDADAFPDEPLRARA